MNEKMTQEQRLDTLVEAFKADSVLYKDLQTPEDSEGKRRILRSLMNIRMPKKLDDSVLAVQDEYLRERISENGIVTLSEIPMIRNGMSIWQGDITALKIDAIVNAANSGMTGCYRPMHNCIDNCIHSGSGVQLRLKMDEIMRRQGHDEPVGSAKISPAYNLPCEYVIHVAGPIVYGELEEEHVNQLTTCYRTCMEVADLYELTSIAFCCISTGVFGFPKHSAAEIAVQTVKDWKVGKNSGIKVIFNVFGDEDLAIYRSKFM